MDENSLSSDSVCSDDTEYLLGQNVSLREIDDFDLKPSLKFEQIEKISSLKFNEGRQSPRIQTETKKMQYPSDSAAARKDQKRRGRPSQNVPDSNMPGYQERGKASVKYSTTDSGAYSNQISRGTPIKQRQASEKVIAESSNLPIREKKDLRKESERKKNLQSGAQHTKARTHFLDDEGRGYKENIFNDNVKQKKESHRSKTKQRNTYEDKAVDLTRVNSHNGKAEKEFDQKKGWRQKLSPGNYDNSWSLKNKDGYDEDYKFDSPEQADVGSIASEATEELLKGDELDGSIIEKLKELNLAVNYDAESQGEIICSLQVIFNLTVLLFLIKIIKTKEKKRIIYCLPA
jgi:hypothetical protein